MILGYPAADMSIGQGHWPETDQVRSTMVLLSDKFYTILNIMLILNLILHI